METDEIQSAVKELKTIRVRWIGLRPVLMSNPQTVDPLNKYTIEAKKINIAKKIAGKKPDNLDQIEILEKRMSRNDWEASAYWDDDIGFFIPAACVEACIRAGAAKARKGKDFQSTVIMNEDRIPIKSKKNFRALDAAFKDPEYVFRHPVKIPPKTGSLVMKSRVIIPTGWTIEFTIDYDPEVISESAMVSAMCDSGSLVGLLGWRPKFGRFTVEILRD